MYEVLLQGQRVYGIEKINPEGIRHILYHKQSILLLTKRFS